MNTLPLPAGSLQDRRIVLVGGAGFIGHNLALTLKKLGAQVEIIDSLQVNNLLAYAQKMPDLYQRDLYLKILHQRLDLLHDAGIPLHVQDARDYHAVGNLLSQIKPHIVVQLAAVAHANRSNKDPYSTFDHSLRTLENALDASRSSVAQFIYFSSSMVYGNFLTPEVTEDSPLNPLGIYGALKFSGEKIVIAYNQVFDLPYTIIRPSALYGPRCVSRRVGQIFIENALNGANLRIDGDGQERIDFTFIEDLVQGVCRAIDNPKAINETFNLTYGSSRSIQDLVEIIRQNFPHVDIENVARDKLIPFRGTLNIDKAKDLLGYDPKNPIEVGFPKYIDWYKSVMPQVTEPTLSHV